MRILYPLSEAEQAYIKSVSDKISSLYEQLEALSTEQIEIKVDNFDFIQPNFFKLKQIHKRKEQLKQEIDELLDLYFGII